MKIETKRLILREWNKKDIPDIIDGLNNLRVSRYLSSVPFPYTKTDAIKFLKKNEKQKKAGKNRTTYNFAIVLRSTKRVIGGIGLNGINRLHKTAGGGIWTNEKYHNHKYGQEAWNALIKFAFNNLKLRKMNNGFIKGNKASEIMQKRIGYKIEGLRKKEFICAADGKIKDEVLTGLLKEEWKEIK